MSDRNAIKVLLALPNMTFMVRGWMMGHIMNGLFLAREIVNRGGQVLFSAAGKEFDVVTKEGFPAVKSQLIPFFGQTREQILVKNHMIASISALYKPDAIVAEFVPYLSLFGAKSVRIPHILTCNYFDTWMVDPTFSLSDLVLFRYPKNQLTSSFIPDSIPPSKIRFVGPFISPDINYVKGQNKNDMRKKLHIPDDKFVILATIGGGTIRQEILKSVADEFKMIKKENSEAYLILNDPNEIFPNTLGDENIMIKRWLSNLPEYMLASDLVIHHGGFTTATEAAAIGTPQIIVTPFLQDEARQNAWWIENAGAGVLCLLPFITPKMLAEKITEIIADTKRREEMSKAAKKLVDGKGAARAAQTILDYVQKSKR